MGPMRTPKIEKSQDLEEIFLDHYGWLLKNARDLYHGSREEAEDLVQDLYVRFVQSRSTLQMGDADRIRAYLYRTLKNLFISKTRRNGRDAVSNLEISDFDSVQIALSAVDGSKLLLVRSQLTKICEYACTRRMTHKAGSVLILRFFFGYYPSEIAQLLRADRAAVDKLTHIARQEAKAYVTRPGVLHFLNQGEREQRSESKGLSGREKRMETSRPQKENLPDDPAELKAELRERILSRAEGVCLSKEEISIRYDDESERPLSTTELAHLVSCRTCLDTANEILGIPSLDMHFSSDEGEHDDNDPPSTGSITERRRPRLRRKERETFEHRPTQLQVAVNGQVLGTTVVNGEFNEFQLNNLDSVGRPEFVEVFSEQGIPLLYLDLLEEDLDGASLQRAYVELSDGRNLTAEMTWSGGAPVVNVSYQDLPAEEAAGEVFTTDNPTLPEVEFHAIGRIQRDRTKLPTWRRFLSWLAHRNWSMSFPVALATGAVLLGFGILLHYSHTRKTAAPVSATTLLDDSLDRENAAIPSDGAMHRTFAFEVRSGQGQIVESGTVDSLRGRAPSRRALQFHDRAGKLVAGHWVNQDGKATDYSAKHRVHSPTKSPKDTVDAAWIHLPEADDFEALTATAAKLTAHQEASGYEISYVNTATSEQPTVIAADLTLTSDTRRPVKERFTIQDHHQTREYRFEELTYELLPASPQLERDFTPTVEPEDLTARVPRDSANGRSDAHLTLEVLLLLNNLGPEVERVVNVERMPDGGTSVNGVFETRAQKEAVESVFAPLRFNHEFRVDLHSGDESAAPGPPHKEPVVESLHAISIEDQRIPLDSDLRTSLSSSGVPDSDLNGRIRDIANDSLRYCSLLHREAWSIHQIVATDFTTGELTSMQPDERMLWLTLLGKHIRAFSQELSSLDSSLAPLFKDQSARSPASELPTDPAIQTVADLRVATQTLNLNSEQLDRLLTVDLTLSPSSLPANHNPDLIEQLLADLRVQESRLDSTIERLQAFRQAGRTE